MDDEEDFRQTLVKRLNRRGIMANQAANGEACLALLSEHPMDVVVLDVKMPGMNGIDVLQRIKQTWRSTEVILLTGHAATQDGVEGIKAGAFDYLSKPVEFEHLLGKIIQAYDKILGGREKQQASEYRARIAQQMIATERLAALGTLAAGVAHEINNPLAIINEAAGYMRLLLDKQGPDMPAREAFQRALDKIENSVKRARAITHQLLGSVRKSESVLAEVHIAELVSETMQMLANEARDKNITLSRQAPADLPPIWVEPNQVRQILINLLSNAIHATPAHGRIWATLAGSAADVSIEIGDTGTGIPRENLEKIFEPFFSTKTPGQGTGLGLYVTRQIVEKLGGTIEVRSRVGQGSQFTVRIPNQAGRQSGH
ncbi:MAG: hybrid sensor histidine kinase/response regulator [Desulfobacteraceae bacterium]|nr:MAG: hybrid sensor histidine kinase/response regulator [Desulfobacteraceae bacterium]